MIEANRNYSGADLQALSRVLKTIAHPVKLEILKVLESQEPLDVSSICAAIGAGCRISMMSQHLSKMKDTGILKSEKKGKQVFYAIADRRVLQVFVGIVGQFVTNEVE